MKPSKTFEKLTKEQKALLLKAPALVSILAAGTDHKMDNREKADAIEMSHLRTFTSDPLLRPYYREVEKVFKSELEKLIGLHIPLNEFSKIAIKDEIEEINKLLGKMDREFAKTLKKSLNSYAKHVHDSDRNVIEYFILPLNISGLND